MSSALSPALASVSSTRVLERAVMRLGRPRPLLVAAFVLSVLVHLAFTFWPASLPETPEEVPLKATITELPPPPQPATVAPILQRKPRVHHTVPWRIPTHSIASLPEATPGAVPDLAAAPRLDESAPPALAQDTPPAPAEERELPPPPAEIPNKTLPPRVDLAYRVFLGTQGFYIGDATYRFEHSGSHYRIHSVGEARGLAALVLRGQGKLESEGLITGSGLQPDQFALVRGEGRKREVAQFDWEAGIVSLDDDKSAALELPTYDPLAFLWQFYFLPPTTDEQTFAIATTRKLYRYTFTREKTEWLELPSGPVETERWHRRSEDGKTDAFVWLAPKLHYVAVKLRFANTERGTVEALLDAIRVDDAASAQ
ncbi:MAG TPA: DUF3108 domain-containing protein [Casimicrobiaceae bacterium]|nr:DUF3108 domain-containing protein [Casimicrobiaceae bacterium]